MCFLGDDKFAANKNVSTLIRIRHTGNREPALHEWNGVKTTNWKHMIANGNFEANPYFFFDCPHDVTVIILIPTKLYAYCTGFVFLNLCSIFTMSQCQQTSEHRHFNPRELIYVANPPPTFLRCRQLFKGLVDQDLI